VHTRQTSTQPGTASSSVRVDAYTSGSTTIFRQRLFLGSNCGESMTTLFTYYTAGRYVKLMASLLAALCWLVVAAAAHPHLPPPPL